MQKKFSIAARRRGKNHSQSTGPSPHTKPPASQTTPVAAFNRISRRGHVYQVIQGHERTDIEAEWSNDGYQQRRAVTPSEKQRTSTAIHSHGVTSP